MNKKRFKQLFIFLSMLILSSFAVYAQIGGEDGFKITEVFAWIGKFIFQDFGAMSAWGFKFLLWIALFSIFEYRYNSSRRNHDYCSKR